MTAQEASLVGRLCEAENPRDLADWEDQDGYYVTTCRVSAEDVPGLIDIVRKWVDPRWPDDVRRLPIDQDNAELLPITAWRTLADLKADAAVEPLVEMLFALDDEFDDWASEDLPQVFGKIGEAAIQPLTDVATSDCNADFVRSIAARGLSCVAHYHANSRNRIVACLTQMMADVGDNDLEFNTVLVAELVALHAVEAAEPIERAFAADRIDVGMIGDWEDVRRELGVEGLGLTMPEAPYNSVEQSSTRMGRGIFSDRAIFTSDDIDFDAAQAYYERASNAFSTSSEAQQVIQEHGALRWFDMLLDFGLNHLGETVDEMTPDSIHNFILDYVPRQVSTDADSAPSIIGELCLFWKYLDRDYKLPTAKANIELLQTEGLVAQLEAELSDPSNFGIAKSFYMSGKKAGYDMTSKEGAAQFMAAYNRSLLSHREPAPAALPIARNQRVGRNAPCPCGSGKKFKKCCGHPSQNDSPQ